MNKVRIGVIGAGNIACSGHLPAYKNIENAELVAICDLNVELAKQAAERFGIPQYFASVEEMIAGADIDAVDICCWNNGHSDTAVVAANAKKHIICEKPMAKNLAEALRMQEAVKANGVTFMLAVPGRFGDGNMYLRNLADKGEFGNIYFAKTAYVRRRGTPLGWFTDKKTSGGGPIIDIGIHGIDSAWYIMGTPKPVRVSAATYDYIGDYQTKGVDRWHGQSCPDNRFDTEDSGAGVIHFENGASMLFEASWAINGPSYSKTEIFGSKAGALLDPLTVYGERDGYLSDDRITMNAGDKFVREITHFCDCVINGKTPVYPIEQAIQMQQMLEGIYRSAAEGKEIELA